MTDFLDLVVEFFMSFSIVGLNLIMLLWIGFSFVGGWLFSEEKKDRMIGTVILLFTGGITFMSNMPEKYIIEVILMLVVILGGMKVLRTIRN